MKKIVCLIFGHKGAYYPCAENLSTKHMCVRCKKTLSERFWFGSSNNYKNISFDSLHTREEER
jgi:hypothetical protein